MIIHRYFDAKEARTATLQEIGTVLSLRPIFSAITRAIRDKQFDVSITGEIARDDKVILGKMGYGIHYNDTLKISYISW